MNLRIVKVVVAILLLLGQITPTEDQGGWRFGINSTLADDTADSIEIIQIKVQRMTSQITSLRREISRIDDRTSGLVARLNAAKAAMDMLLDQRKTLLCQMRGLRSYTPCMTNRTETIDLAYDVCATEANALAYKKPKAGLIALGICVVAKHYDKSESDGYCQSAANKAFDACTT
jgi:hypothetical protein